ncbi:MAG: ATP-dependent RecD-like DNA helicase [Christensenellaceae bacterium]
METVVLTPDQERAKEAMKDWFFNRETQVFMLSGYAGTGKTFLINYVVQNEFHLVPDRDVTFVTPTGKAATVLIRSGTPAGTIHSLIYRKEEIEEKTVDENGEIVVRQKLVFKKRGTIDEQIKLLVIDEASMVNDETVQDLLSFGVKCLFSGDEAQLPPVHGRNTLRPDYTLTEIVRQEETNPIVFVSVLARQGEEIPLGVYGKTVCVIDRRKFSGAERKRLLLKADQIICGANATRLRLNQEIRGYLGYTGELPSDGEKLICTLNNWDRSIDFEERFHLVNGIIGYVEDVEYCPKDLAKCSFRAEFLEDVITEVPFDTGVFTGGNYTYSFGKERMVCILSDGSVVPQADGKRNESAVEAVEPANHFEFGYAITCHKAQGSEFPFVIVFDESRFFGEDRNKWLYTAITRAREKLLIVR